MAECFVCPARDEVVECTDTAPADATGTDGYVCSDYIGYESTCGDYDDADHIANNMCCVCGGGANSTAGPWHALVASSGQHPQASGTL